ncbi:efflux RND transporter periplasmic adaptor subunit [bacterium]|nr:efflux RND transporter periplasmic adaptor subunit [bacterium]
MKKVIIIIIIILIAIALFLAGVRQVKKSHEELPKSISEMQEAEGIPVEVETVSIGTFVLSRTYLGTIEGALQADAKVSIVEKIVEIPVKVGDRVEKGQVVCRLDTKAVTAQYNQAKLAFDDAQREVERMKKLYESGAISKQALEKAELNRNIMKQNLESSSELVALSAPIDGIVTDIFYHVGETPEMGDAVVKIADLSKLKVKFQINHQDRRMIDGKTPVYLRVNGDGETEIKAAVSEISISANPDNRLFNVWILADNIKNLLHPGLLVDVRMEIIRKPQVKLIPRNSLITRNEQTGVFIINDNKIAEFKAIQPGLENTNYIEVNQGLTEGQLIVVYGQNNLSDGKLVKIVNS